MGNAFSAGRIRPESDSCTERGRYGVYAPIHLGTYGRPWSVGCESMTPSKRAETHDDAVQHPSGDEADGDHHLATIPASCCFPWRSE